MRGNKEEEGEKVGKGKGKSKRGVEKKGNENQGEREGEGERGAEGRGLRVHTQLTRYKLNRYFFHKLFVSSPFSPLATREIYLISWFSSSESKIV